MLERPLAPVRPCYGKSRISKGSGRRLRIPAVASNRGKIVLEMSEARLQQARADYEQRAWAKAHRLYSQLDESTELAGPDLERMATAAYLIGKEEEYLRLLERAHHRYLEEDVVERACRCAFWQVLTLLLRGEVGQASGWLGRAHRLLEDRDCVEQGYLLLPEAEKQMAEGDVTAALESATRAGQIAARFGDSDLAASAFHMQGRVLIRQGEVGHGLELLDEVMIAVTGGKLSPIVTGLIYCSVIDACQQIFASGRAQEWTQALSRWCERQPELVAFTGKCLVQRAEVLQLRGDWKAALAEASQACEPERKGEESKPPAAAFYRRGEIHRLRGEFAAAEAAFRQSSRRGREPQPGLAMLRATQGDAEAGLASLRRMLASVTDPLRRARLLPAVTEVALSAGALEEAHSAAEELQAIAARFETDVLTAKAAEALGAVELADGNPKPALKVLRESFATWSRCEAPYGAARVRVLVGLACRELGDEESAQLEFESARATFERLGARPDIARLDALRSGPEEAARDLLTPRESQVLRQIADGMTNREIAGELQVSERTIDRHVSNILAKFGVSSRAAATAYAYRNNLL